jgi:hypothetical protein
MRRIWRFPTGRGGPVFMEAAPPWHCQLMHVESTETFFLLDLVALDDCPVAHIARPAGTPFTMAISQDDDPFDAASMARSLGEWAVDADVVVIRAGLRDGAMWMCLSGDGGDLYIRIRS